MKTARTFFAVAALAISALAWGWHEDKPAGAAFQPEVTDQRLTKDQSYQRTQGVVGRVADSQRDSAPIDPEMSNSQSEENVVNAEPNSDAALQALRDADSEPRRAKGSHGAAVWAALVLGLLGCAALAAVRWANRNIPEPLAVQHRKW